MIVGMILLGAAAAMTISNHIKTVNSNGAIMELWMTMPTLDITALHYITSVNCDTTLTSVSFDRAPPLLPSFEFLLFIPREFRCNGDEYTFFKVFSSTSDLHSISLRTLRIDPFDYILDYHFHLNTQTSLSHFQHSRIERRWLDHFTMQFEKEIDWNILYDQVRERMIGTLLVIYADELLVAICFNCYSKNKVNIKITVTPDVDGHPKIHAEFKRDTFIYAEIIIILRKTSESQALRVELSKFKPAQLIDFPGLMRIGPTVGIESYIMYELNYGKGVLIFGFDATVVDSYEFNYNTNDALEKSTWGNHKFEKPFSFNLHKPIFVMDCHAFIRPLFAPYMELTFESYGRLRKADMKFRMYFEVGPGSNFMAFFNWHFNGLCPPGHIAYDFHKYITFLGLVFRGDEFYNLTPLFVIYEPLMCDWCNGCIPSVKNFIPPLSDFPFNDYAGHDKSDLEDRMLKELRRSGVI